MCGGGSLFLIVINNETPLPFRVWPQAALYVEPWPILLDAYAAACCILTVSQLLFEEQNIFYIFGPVLLCASSPQRPGVRIVTRRYNFVVVN